MNDISGQTFSRLLVVEKVSKPDGGKAKWRCVCSCGNTMETTAYSLRSGETRSCGCLRAELLADRNKIIKRNSENYRSRHPREYWSFMNMRSRCGNPKNPMYADYGGRGIKVCDEWATFAQFYADMGDRPEGMTLDRKDTNGDYEPSNCRWATYEQQANNRRNNRLFEHDGRSMTIARWAAQAGIKKSSLAYRLKAGWTIERALSQKMQGRQSHD